MNAFGPGVLEAENSHNGGDSAILDGKVCNIGADSASIIASAAIHASRGTGDVRYDGQAGEVLVNTCIVFF